MSEFEIGAAVPFPVSVVGGVTIGTIMAGVSMVGTVVGTVSVTGPVSIAGTVPVSVSAGVNVSGTVGITGPVSIAGTIPVSVSAGVNVSGTVNVAGPLVVGTISSGLLEVARIDSAAGVTMGNQMTFSVLNTSPTPGGTALAANVLFAVWYSGTLELELVGLFVSQRPGSGGLQTIQLNRFSGGPPTGGSVMSKSTFDTADVPDTANVTAMNGPTGGVTLLGVLYNLDLPSALSVQDFVFLPVNLYGGKLPILRQNQGLALVQNITSALTTAPNFFVLWVFVQHTPGA